jgi:hypothetical protein
MLQVSILEVMKVAETNIREKNIPIYTQTYNSTKSASENKTVGCGYIKNSESQGIGRGLSQGERNSSGG